MWLWLWVRVWAWVCVWGVGLSAHAVAGACVSEHMCIECVTLNLHPHAQNKW